MNKRKLKALLKNKTSCTLQHTGWPCGTCFFSISDELRNSDWQALLWFRGDYKETELDHLPEHIQDSLETIASLGK